jgi:hypothetical protein
MQWRDCPTEPLAWIPLRELLLSVLLTPALLLPLVAVLPLLLAWWLRLPWLAALAIALLLSSLYCPSSTNTLSFYTLNSDDLLE